MAGDIWPGYSVQRIEWTSTNIDNIKIESSLDSGRTWNLIINSYPASAQYYDWEVPNKVSDSCFIRITDIANTATSSSNYRNNPFRIPPAGITLDSLATAQFMHTTLPVTWTSSGVRKLNLSVSYDNQVSFQKIADSIPANRFYYNWVIPAISSNQVSLKLQDAEKPSLVSISPVAFTIQPLTTTNTAKYKGGSYDGHTVANNQLPKLSFTSPAGIDSAFGSEVYTIRWTQNNVDQVTLQYSLNDGVSWNTIVSGLAATGGRYAWTVPNSPTTQGRLRILNSTDSSNQEITAFPFIIRKKILQVTSPQVENTVYRGTVLPISWNSGGISLLRIICLYNNKTLLVRDSVPVQNETFNWIIPDTLTGSCRIVIQDRADATASDTSAILTMTAIPKAAAAKFRGGSFDGHSALSGQRPQLQLLTPKEGEKIAVSMTVSVNWKANNLERVHLYFSSNNGGNWTRIASNIAASAGSYDWRTPNSTSSQCLLRIEDATDSTVFDQSKTNFTLLPKQIGHLTDSLNWIRRTAKTLEWSTLGIDAIRIYYKLRENDTWTLLRDSIPAAYQACNWIVPASLKDTVWIRLQDRADSTVLADKYYTSLRSLAENFSATKYRGGSFDGHTQRSNITKIIVQRPVENEVLTSGTIYTIKWSTVNLEDSIVLQYSVDSGATWTTIARTLANLGLYEWRIPAVLSSYQPPQFMSIKTQSTGTAGGYLYQTNGGSGVANKCLIRALDPTSGNTLVGISSKPFTIAAKDVPLKADIKFPLPEEKEYRTGLQIMLAASSQTKNPVTYFVTRGAATVAGDTLWVSEAGPITIGAFVAARNGYLGSDTLYQSFCVNPIRPIIQVNGDTSACANDTLTLRSSVTAGNQWYRNGQPIMGGNESSLRVFNGGIYTDSLNVSGCRSGSLPMTVQFKTRPVTPILTANRASICTGDSAILRSSHTTTNRWLFNGTMLANQSDSVLVTRNAGKYQVIASDNGCFSDTSNALNILLNQSPAPPQVSPIRVCQGTPISLSAVKTRGNELLWYPVATGGTAFNGTPVIASDKPGQTLLYASQKDPATGCESERATLLIAIGSVPVQPVITRNGDRLISTPAKQYQWYRNNLPLTAADSSQLKIPASGTYQVAVSTDSSCWLRSAGYLVQEDPVLAAQDSLQVLAYPNPAQGQFFVQVQAQHPINGFINLQLFDMNGVPVTSLQRFVFNEKQVRIPVYIYLNKSLYTIRVTVNGYQTKNIQLIGL